jgi:hypothetical protein
LTNEPGFSGSFAERGGSEAVGNCGKKEKPNARRGKIVL